MSHSYTSCLVHYVFSTKERHKTISPEIRERLWAYLGGIARENGLKALAIGGTDNHCHMLVALPSTVSVAKAIQLIKGGSSKWIHDTFPSMRTFAWQAGYGAFSIGLSGIEDTIAYINNQQEHHRTRTFEEEFATILAKHGIVFNPAYVFG